MGRKGSADPHAVLALLFMEGIQRQTLGCGSGTGVTTYTPEDAPRTVGITFRSEASLLTAA